MSNAWAICLQVEDSLPKGGLILNVIAPGIRGCLKMGILRDLSPVEKPASYQLVGEVTAHQGIDG